MPFFRFLMERRVIVLILAAVVIFLGALSWTRLPIDAFPDVTNTQVTVLTEAPGLATIDVEDRVTFPLEQLLRGLPKVTQVRSLSKAGFSQVVIVFDDDAETWWTRQVVFERVSEARSLLPPGIEPELGPISTGLGEVFQYTLESDSHDAMELRSLQDWLVAPLLKPLPGVNEVNSFGGYVKQVQVLVSPQALLEYGLEVEDIVAAVEAGNSNGAGGIVVQGWEQMFLRGVGLAGGIPDLERIVLRAQDGTPVYLRDVAELTIGAETRQGAVTRDGQGEAVAGMIIMLKGENSREVVLHARKAVEKIGGMLPPGVRLNVFYDRTSLIQACIHTVTDALLEGGLLVVIVLFLFVAEVRSALIVLFSLPFTFLASFIVMRQLGMSSNLMSLGGLAFSVGMVVDASIVVVENIRRHLAVPSEGSTRRQIVIDAILEVARPVSFSVLIIAIIILPLFTLQGIEGKMFAPLALTLLIALLISLAVALTVIPVISELALPQAPEREFRFIKKIHEGYLLLLDHTMRRRKTTLAISGLFLVAALGLLPFLGTDFMPPLDEGAIAINVVRLPNASLEGSVAVATYLEKRLLAFPEVDTVVSKTGRAEVSEDPMGPEQTDVIISLKARKAWGRGRSREELVAAMQEDLGQIPGLRFSFSQPIALRVNELISGVKSDLAVKVFGPDLDKLKDVADRAAALVGSVEGAEDLKVEQVSGMSQVDVVLDRSALARHGIAVSEVNGLLETALAGKVATTLIEGQRRVAVVVRFPEAARSDLGSIERLLLSAPGGERVPLAELARIEVVEAPAQITRENGMRRVVVETNVRGRDLGGFVEEVQASLAPLERELPPGFWIEYGGQFENQQRAMRQLGIVVPLALLLILILLTMALGRLRNALLVLLNLPFALVGGVIAVVLFRMPVSVSAAVAFIVLLGVAVQNGIVLVAFIAQLEARGMAVRDAVRQACSLRFRPLLMTALTSFIGHLPMLYAMGSGADIQRPLAVVVMGGLVTCTLLTLLVLPTVYDWVGGGESAR